MMQNVSRRAVATAPARPLCLFRPRMPLPTMLGARSASPLTGTAASAARARLSTSTSSSSSSSSGPAAATTSAGQKTEKSEKAEETEGKEEYEEISSSKKWTMRALDVLLGGALGATLFYGIRFALEWPDCCEHVIEQASKCKWVQDRVGLPLSHSLFWTGNVRDLDCMVIIPISGPNGKARLEGRCARDHPSHPWTLILLQCEFEGSPQRINILTNEMVSAPTRSAPLSSLLRNDTTTSPSPISVTPNTT